MNIEEVYARIEEHQDRQLPFVIYRKPDTNKVTAFLQSTDTLYLTKKYIESGFVFAPFDVTKETILIPSNDSICVTATVQKQNKSVNEAIFSNQDLSDKILVAKEAHEGLVKKGLTAIQSKKFKKVVLSRKERVTGLSRINGLEMLDKLLHSYPQAFVYYWCHPKVGSWLGATPETLLKVEDTTLITMALAGTQPFKEKEKVIWGEKELEEQQMVTQYIVKELANISNTVDFSDTYTHRAGSLLHLKTDIKVDLSTSKKTVNDILDILHPTPAVCGLPKKEAKDFILKHEGYDRKFYTGFLGEIGVLKDQKTISNLFVNLRCMELLENKVDLYVGGGVTKDSIAKNEWEETVNKTKTMKRVLF